MRVMVATPICRRLSCARVRVDDRRTDGRTRGEPLIEYYAVGRPEEGRQQELGATTEAGKMTDRREDDGNDAGVSETNRPNGKRQGRKDDKHEDSRERRERQEQRDPRRMA